jgi:hypothetical protein
MLARSSTAAGVQNLQRLEIGARQVLRKLIKHRLADEKSTEFIL